jgi:hypothetical protein
MRVTTGIAAVLVLWFGRAVEFPLWNEGPLAFLIEDITLVRVQEGVGSPIRP